MLDTSGRLRESEVLTDAIGQSLNLGMGTTHGGSGFTAVQGRGQRRVKLRFLGALVGQNPLREQGVGSRK